MTPKLVVSARFHDVGVVTPKVTTLSVDVGCRDGKSSSFGTILLRRSDDQAGRRDAQASSFGTVSIRK